MLKQKINLVWLKRDIRSRDHQPFQLAEQADLPYLILFILEPSMMEHGDLSLRHLQFQYHAILDLNTTLSPFQKKVVICHHEAPEVFRHLTQVFDLHSIFSYRESGIAITYERDKQVAHFCRAHQIKWVECQRDGILRGIKNRDEWDKNWFLTMQEPLLNPAFTIRETPLFENPFPIAEDLMAKLSDYPQNFQPAGERYAWKYLQSFVAERGKSYSKYISKPLESRTSCGRISPYLSWGNISIRQVYQFVRAYAKNDKSRGAFQNFLTRLKWHCHFIQKFEVDCRYEDQCINAGYELLEHPKNEAWIEAWKQGKTGYPLVDACMKCLRETGWINFRMRAMLVSFLCHHLYQDWRFGTQHLANLFLDYEPGIHYPQFQMQAGTTGINTVRMYNPVKQSKDHDPEGIFIKHWLPELAGVPKEYIHEPHQMTELEQTCYRAKIGEDYPFPVVDITEAGKMARENIWAHRKHALVQEENIKIITVHTRRKSGA
jgi:deoxyribodipyrimidine photo-lyase